MHEKVLWLYEKILKRAHNKNKTLEKDKWEKRKMKLLTKEQQESYENAKICYIYHEKF